MPGCNRPDRDCASHAANIIPRESEQTSFGSRITIRNDQPTDETKQMTATASGAAGAVSHKTIDWDIIDWNQINSNVRRLQSRIVKATEQQRWGKVKSLQRLLTRSFSAKALAVKRVSDNVGKRTPGVDGVRWNTSRQKSSAVGKLKQRGYQARPLRRIYIPKNNGKYRSLGIPTMHDRAMQALYLLALDPCAETTADTCSYGFRVGRSCADAIHHCFVVLSKKTSATWVLEGDIRACFDNISHQWLLANTPMETRILQQWLKAGYIEKQRFHRTDAGTPQGGIISPLLSNIALNGLEPRLREVFPKARTHSQANRVYLIRYADDFIVTADSPELLRDKVQPVVESFLRERGLEFSKEKTRITSISEGFNFLGQNLRKHNGKLITTPSKDSVKQHLTAVRETISTHQTARAGMLIVRLNPILRGWANYHRHVVSKRTFVSVDHAIFMALWRWACRRHPNKSRRWIKRKYFRQSGGRNWVFYGVVPGPDDCPKTVQLFVTSSLPIKRHSLIKGTANPYCESWSNYFDHRSRKRATARSPVALHSSVAAFYEMYSV